MRESNQVIFSAFSLGDVFISKVSVVGFLKNSIRNMEAIMNTAPGAANRIPMYLKDNSGVFFGSTSERKISNGVFSPS